jgi:hypothetical protein
VTCSMSYGPQKLECNPVYSVISEAVGNQVICAVEACLHCKEKWWWYLCD